LLDFTVDCCIIAVLLPAKERSALETATHDYTDDIVLIPVPRRYQQVVHRALADAMEASLTSPQAPTPEAPRDDKPAYPEIPWSEEDINRLKGQSLNATSRSMLDLSAEGAGEWISIRDVERRAGRTHPEARAELAGFTQLIKRRFGRKNWPVQVEWGAGGEEHVYYRLSPELTSAWTDDEEA
jgi:hypothetical protein